MTVPVWLWTGTLAAVVLLFTLDLLVVGRRARVPTPAESARWTAFYCGCALAFGLVVLAVGGWRYAGEFYAGWLTEYSLSVDNLVVFLVVMARFGVPASLQTRVLTVGIVLALVLRGVLIAAGAALITSFSWVFYLFGAFLVWTAWRVWRSRHDEPEEGSEKTLGLVRRLLPATDRWHGTALTAREGGRRVATPLLVVLVAIGATDLLFALDSIPAVFGLTQEPFLVVTANAFALLGLRQLFFLVGGLLRRLVFLSQGLALVLCFIGVQLVLDALRENSLPFVHGGEPLHQVPDVPVLVSLGFVVVTLAATAGLSLLHERRTRDREERRQPVP